MPFGPKNVTIIFQWIMDIILVSVTNIKCYIDDVLVHIDIFKEFLAYLEDLFKWLRKTKLKCHPKK